MSPCVAIKFLSLNGVYSSCKSSFQNKLSIPTPSSFTATLRPQFSTKHSRASPIPPWQSKTCAHLFLLTNRHRQTVPCIRRELILVGQGLTRPDSHDRVGMHQIRDEKSSLRSGYSFYRWIGSRQAFCSASCVLAGNELSS